MTDVHYDENSRRYRYTRSGRLVPEARVRRWLDQAIDASAARLRRQAERLVAGDTSLAVFQRVLMQEIKAGNLAAVIVAKGGKGQMDVASYGFAGSHIKRNYQYARNWLASIVDGRAPVDKRLPARAELYAQSVRATYEAAKARGDQAAGLEQERNVLGSGDPCSQCPELSARGWVRSGSLPLPGSRLCKARCRCHIERRMAPREAAA